MKEIMLVALFGILTYGTYKLFELFVGKKERLSLIEKLGSQAPIDPTYLKGNLQPSGLPSFTALKAGCLLLGTGLGLLIGFAICALSIQGYLENGTHDISWELKNVIEIIYGSCVLIFGGVGLLAAFLIELKHTKNNK